MDECGALGFRRTRGILAVSRPGAGSANPGYGVRSAHAGLIGNGWWSRPGRGRSLSCVGSPLWEDSAHPSLNGSGDRQRDSPLSCSLSARAPGLSSCELSKRDACDQPKRGQRSFPNMASSAPATAPRLLALAAETGNVGRRRCRTVMSALIHSGSVSF